VRDQHVDLPTVDGVMPTFITHPEEGGPFPVVFFYMDAPGMREELHDMARRLGTAGYYVVLPNLYYRTTTEENIDLVAPGARERMFELMASLDDTLVARDTEAMFAQIDADPTADFGSVGCVGYCMSGPFVFAMAATFPDRIKAAASIYGVRLFGDGSPAHRADQIKGELYFACAEHDTYAPTEMIEQLEAHLAPLDVTSRVEWYPGTHHGFAFQRRGAVYDRDAAERHWERLHALFDRTLRRQAVDTSSSPS
jgi:carboxymethylenebutenolidase